MKIIFKYQINKLKKNIFNQDNKNILFIIDTIFLGDSIRDFLLIYQLKIKYPSHNLYIKIDSTIPIFLKTFNKNIFNCLTSKEINNMFFDSVLVIKPDQKKLNINCKRYIYLDYKYVKYNMMTHCIIKLLDKDIRPKIHTYIKNFLINLPNRNQYISVGIGSKTAVNKGLKLNDFQNLIYRLIINNPNIKFMLLGLKKEIINNNLKLVLNNSNVINNLDENIKDRSFLEITNLIYNSKVYIGKSSGFLHLAGICNVDSIYFSHQKINYSKKIYNNNKLFFKETWTPLSDNIFRINDRKPKLNLFFEKVSKYINKKFI